MCWQTIYHVIMLLPTIRPAGGQTAGLYVSRLDVAVQHYFEQGVAQSTLKTYFAAWKKFNQFCTVHNVTISFPISQSVLCYFVAYLGEQGLSNYLDVPVGRQVLPDRQRSLGTWPYAQVKSGEERS